MYFYKQHHFWYSENNVTAKQWNILYCVEVIILSLVAYDVILGEISNV
jgi:hypothetical protein